MLHAVIRRIGVNGILLRTTSVTLFVARHLEFCKCCFQSDRVMDVLKDYQQLLVSTADGSYSN